MEVPVLPEPINSPTCGLGQEGCASRVDLLEGGDVVHSVTVRHPHAVLTTVARHLVTGEFGLAVHGRRSHSRSYDRCLAPGRTNCCVELLHAGGLLLSQGRRRAQVGRAHGHEDASTGAKGATEHRTNKCLPRLPSSRTIFRRASNLNFMISQNLPAPVDQLCEPLCAYSEYASTVCSPPVHVCVQAGSRTELAGSACS